MKKYILGIVMVSMLATVNTGMAMEKGKKKREVKTSLTHKQQTELRKAVKGIKSKPLADSRKEQLIVNKYLDQLDAGDSFVKAQVKEASRAYKLKKYGPNYREID